MQACSLIVRMISAIWMCIGRPDTDIGLGFVQCKIKGPVCDDFNIG
jgi:hypothetical protein